MSKGALSLLLLALLGAALFEAWPRAVATEQHWAAAAQRVTTGFQRGDLIVSAPGWTDPLLRQQLGQLMPAPMVGRPDAGRYARIWEISLRGARHPETRGLAADLHERFGPLHLARYLQTPRPVLYDLVDRYDPSRVAPPGGRVERRVMEIDYQPRYGLVVTAEPGRAVALEYADLPAEAFGAGAELWLWAGLHDYYARKTESGPGDLTVLIDGQRRGALAVAQPWRGLRVPLKDLPPGPHRLRLEVSARDARARFIGLAAEVRQ